jgi:acetyl-CoA carboxylase biotin carboxyl carrier protein
MPLDDDDVREILRLIDETDVEELHVEVEGVLVHVVRSRHDAEVEDEHAEPDAEPAAADDGLRPIPAPMLGTFYRAPAPGATPFVDVGARIEEDTVVCLIEVMKMMNAVPAGVAGTVVEVCATNAELVEAGDPLFRVRVEA